MARYTRVVGKAVAIWFVSNATWALVSGSFGFVLSAVLHGLVGVANVYLLVAVALLAAAAAAAIAPRAWAARRHELAVRIKSDRWDNFQHLARILELEVEITNSTNKPKHILSYGLHYDAQGGAFDVEVFREVERRKQAHQRLDAVSVIEPKGSARGWLVYGLPLAPEIKGPIPYRLTVRDELNLDYEALPPR